MKLLVITQKVDQNDSTLAFFEKWLKVFSDKTDSLIVISQSVGEHSLPDSVKVFSLGKENGVSKLNQLKIFIKLALSLSKDYDTVFVHMNPIYLALMGWYWRMSHKKIGLWYTHRNVDLKLRIAHWFAHKVFTASKEGFSLKSNKKILLGHGIDIESFVCPPKDIKGVTSIIHVGRITKIKNCGTLIEALNLLNQKGIKVELKFIGETVYEADREYKKVLEGLIEKYNLKAQVKFAGPAVYESLPKIYCENDISVNLAPTGGMDKVVLESLSSSRPVFVANHAFSEFFGNSASLFMFKERSADDLANKISIWIKEPDYQALAKLTAMVKSDFNIPSLIDRIIKELS